MSAAAFWSGVGAFFVLRDARTPWLAAAWAGAFLELDISLRYGRGWALGVGVTLLALSAVRSRVSPRDEWVALLLACVPLVLGRRASASFVALGPAYLLLARSPSRRLRALAAGVVLLATVLYTSAWPSAWLSGWKEGFLSKAWGAASLAAACAAALLARAWRERSEDAVARWSPVAGSGLLYGALAVAWTYPLAFRLDSVIAHDAGDPLLNAWIVWWNAQAVPFTQAWWDAPIFHPAPGSFALSEHLFGLSLLTTPLQWLGASAVAAYNLAFLLAIPLACAAAHALCHRLTRRHDVSVLGGLAFGFAPFRVAHLAHIQVLCTAAMPLCLLGLHRYLETRRRRDLLLFAASWTLLGLTNGYYLLYLPVLFLLWVAWFARPFARSLLPLGLAAAAALLAMAPALRGYVEVHERFGYTRTAEDVVLGSASFASFLDASPLLVVSGRHERSHPSAEGWVFPGLGVVLLVTAGLLHARKGADRQRSTFAFYSAATLALWLMCLGPSMRLSTSDADGLPGPFRALQLLPGYGGLRAPARFAMVAALCLAVAAALAAARLCGPTRRGRIAVGVAASVVVAEGWIDALPLVPLPRREPLLETIGSQATAVLEVPPGDWQDEPPAMYRAMYHRLPLLNGFSGHTPPHYFALSAGLLAHDGDTLEAIAETGRVALLLHGERDPNRAFARFLESHPALRERARSGTRRLFVLGHRPVGATTAASAVGIARLRASPRGEDAPLMTDGDLASRWTADRPQFGQEVVEVELAGEHEVNAVALSVGRFREDYPRRLAIDTSRDGREWTEAWRGTGFAPAFRAALRSPRAMPVRFDFTPRQARHVRLRQSGSDPVMWWSIAELEVLGPPRQPAVAVAGRPDGHR